MNRDKGKSESNKYVNNLITRILLSIIIFFGVIIFRNYSSNNEKLYNKYYVDNNISFSRFTKYYNKYFGKIIPMKENKTSPVFSEKMKYKSLSSRDNHYILKVDTNYLVPVINSGLVVYIGNKDNLCNTIIIEGIDEVDYWYSNITNTNVKLYDYVSKGSMLGTSVNDKLILTFLKKGQYLKYEDVVK